MASDWWMYHSDPQHSGNAAGTSSITSNNVQLQTSREVQLDGNILSAPSIAAGKIYVGTDKGTLYKVDLQTLSVDSLKPVGGNILASPAISGGRVYFANYVPPPPSQRVPARCIVYCAQADTLQELWATDLANPDQAHRQPVTNPHAQFWSSPLVINGKVYVGCGWGEGDRGHSDPAYGFVYCLDASSGNVVWLFCTNQFGGWEEVKVSHGAIVVAVGPDSVPWVVDDRGSISRLVGNTLQPLPGAANDIAVGADGSAWVVGTNAVQGGYGIFQWNGSGWDKRPGGAVRIAVGPDGRPWVVNDQNGIFQWDGNTFQSRPGAGSDIAVGADGSVWVVGTNPVPDGYGLFRWNGRAWNEVPGGAQTPSGAVSLAVGSNGQPWVINDKGAIFQRGGSTFQSFPGAATDIAVGSEGSVWVVGTDPVQGGYGIHRWNGSGWTDVSGGAVRIGVGPDGRPWVVNDQNGIFQWDGNTFQPRPGAGRDIAVGADGSVWVVGTDPVQGGYGIHRWNGSGWTDVSGGAVRIGVGPDGRPWVVNDQNGIFQWDGNTFQPRPGAGRDIAVGADGSVWVVGTDKVSLGGVPIPHGYGLHYWNRGDWAALNDPTRGAVGAVAVTVGPDGEPWVANDQGNIFRFVETAFQPVPGAAKDIAIGANGAVWVIGTNPVQGGYGIYRWVQNRPNVIPHSAVGISPLPPGFSEAPNPPSQGSSVWSSCAYDDHGPQPLIYVGTGNSTQSGPLPDAWYGSGVLALMANDGSFVGFFQPAPEDSYRHMDADVDIPAGPTVFMRGGKPIVAVGSKNGSFFLLDASNLSPLRRRQLLPRYNGDGFPEDGSTPVNASTVPTDNTPPVGGVGEEGLYQEEWEQFGGVYGSAAVHFGLGRLFVGLGRFLPSGNHMANDSTLTPFMRALDWNTL